MITPWPGTGRCNNCGFKPEGDVFWDIAGAVAQEAGKYLGKDGGAEGVVKKLTRSGGTHRCCPECDARLVHRTPHKLMCWCPKCARLVVEPVVKVTGWQEIRRRALAQKLKSRLCSECGDEHP